MILVCQNGKMLRSGKSKTHRILPLGLPQRLDAIMMRHASLERLLAHDPLRPLLAGDATATLTLPLAGVGGGGRGAGRHDDNSKRNEKTTDRNNQNDPIEDTRLKKEMIERLGQRSLDNPDDLLLGDDWDAFSRARDHCGDGASPATMNGWRRRSDSLFTNSAMGKRVSGIL